MTGLDCPAIGHGVEKRFSPIEGLMESDGKPQIAGAPQCQAEKETYQGSANQAEPSLARISPVQPAEGRRQNGGSRPETQGIGQRELRVAAEQELLKESDQEKEETPEDREFKDANTMQGQVSKVEAVESADRHQEDRDGKQSPKTADPEEFSESLAAG